MARLPRDERRAQLLAAAQESFGASGFHAASMEEIADRAGVSKPVLYQHFPSKLDLYLAVLDIHIDALIFELQKAIASKKENVDRVQATTLAYFTLIDQQQEVFKILFESDIIAEPSVQDRINRMTYECARAVSAVISVDTGLPEEAAMLLGVGLIGTAQITARYWLGRDGRLPLEQAAELVSRLQWKGIASFPMGSH